MNELIVPAGCLVTSIVLSICISIPLAWYSRRFWPTKRRGTEELYHDEDGMTTPEAQAAYEKTAWRHIAALLSLSVAGLGINIVSAVLTKTDLKAPWKVVGGTAVGLTIAASAILVFQAVIVAWIYSPTWRRVQGTIAGISSLLVYGTNIYCDALQALNSKANLCFLVLHSILLLGSASLTFTLQGRPQLFAYNNSAKPIDGEGTVSLVSKYTLSWANPLLSLAVRKGGLDFQDLAWLHDGGTTKTLVEHFHTFVTVPALWRKIIHAHFATLAYQWILTFCLSFATLMPQYFLWRLIKVLEMNAVHPAPEAGLWVMLLGLAPMLQSWIETWMLWLGWCHVALPVSVQLSGLIIEKSLMKKDIKDIEKRTEEEGPSGASFEELCSKIKRMEGGNKNTRKIMSEKKEKLVPKRMQDQINLITIDAQRISDFLSYNPMVIGTLLSISISLFFLLSIIRIEAILAGMAGVSFIVPINVYANRRYAKVQNTLMSARDLKTSILTEGMQGIRQIKFDALEPQWIKRIHMVRSAELSQQWNAYLAETMLLMCWIAGPLMFGAIALSVVSIYDGYLSPSVAFTALAVFQRLEGTLSLVPGLVTDLSNAWISLSRIEQFLASPEREDTTVDAHTISFEGATVAWPSDEGLQRTSVLQGLNLTFPAKALSIIAGPTGAGKSLLLAAMIGEADILLGTVRRPKTKEMDLFHDGKSELSHDKWLVSKSIAFVAQTPWIENGTVRDNVLFGLPFVESRYKQVLHACAFWKDISAMEDGDLTAVGAHGISLSGGQRSRLSLARALYSRADTLIIDDIFSAVDTHVARHLLNHALTGELADGRTRLLATHSVQLCLSKAKFAVMLNHEGVEYAGSPDILLLHSSIIIDSNTDSKHPGAKKGSASASASASWRVFQGDEVVPSDSGISQELVHAPNESPAQTNLDPDIDVIPHNIFREPSEPMKEEQRAKGRMKLSVIEQYLRAANRRPWLYWSTVIALLIAFEVTLIGRNWWIKAWSEQYEYKQIVKEKYDSLAHYQVEGFQETMGLSTLAAANHRNTFYIVGCILISLLTSLLGTFKFLWAYIGSLSASSNLSKAMLTSVLHAPLRWLDTVPPGRILNRFLADFTVVDSVLANHLVLLAYYILQLIGIIVAGSLVSPTLLPFAGLLVALCMWYAWQYLAGARDLKRLESIKRSPILEQLDSLLSGLPTIRAWNRSFSYTERLYTSIDEHARCVWHLWLLNRWLGMRFAFIGAIFSLCVAAVSVYSPQVSAALAGLALTFSLDFTQAVFWVLRRYADIEMDMNSLERINEYCDIESERSEGIVPPANWPHSGQIEISNLIVGYFPDLPPVLRSISLSCAAKSRIGIVGRTGAGKSSLALALFRFLEAQAGSIMIDGLDISTIAVHELRRRISIIPQQPVLWLGSVRSNLDPFNKYNDYALNEILKRVQLSQQYSPKASDHFIEERNPDAGNSRYPFELSTPISEGGLNISLGQRQLICLARVLLSRPKILIMDEATSGIDVDTDSIVQRSIKTELEDCTLIVIAHKLSSVIGLDTVVVLDAGKVVEMGKPKELWMKNGAFARMVLQSCEMNLVAKLKE